MPPAARPVIACLAIVFSTLLPGSARLPAQEPGTLAAAVKPFVDREELAGAVMLVADADEVLDVEAVGWADLAARKPMRPDAIFWIASQSKPITAAALMMLVDEGKVHLDDPVEQYLPEFHGQMAVVKRDDEHVLLRRPQHPNRPWRSRLSTSSRWPRGSAVTP